MGLFSSRRERLKKLGTELNIDYTVEKELEVIELSLQNVVAMREMVQTEGWEILEEAIREFIRQQGNSVVELAGEPEQNKYKLVMHRAMMTTAKKIVNLINNSLEQGGSLTRRRQELRQEQGGLHNAE